jgi:hypothetical protein
MSMYQTIKNKIITAVLDEVKKGDTRRHVDAMLEKSKELLFEYQHASSEVALSLSDQQRLLTEAKREFENWLELHP